MRFPKSLDILLPAILVKNVSKTGEVTDGWTEDFPIIELLSKELGFTYMVYSKQTRQYGDLSVGNFILQEDWFNKSTYPFGITDFTFVTVKPAYLSNSLASLRPFTVPVWITLLLSIVLMTFVKFLIFRGRMPILSVLFYVLTDLLGQQSNWKPKSKAQKLVILTWGVGITFLTLIYADVILSFLTVPVREKGITNFNELYSAIMKGKATALKFEGSTMEIVLITSGSEKLKFIGEHIQKQDAVSRWIGGNSYDVIKPNVAIFGPRAVLEVQFGGEGYFISADSVFLGMRIMYDVTENGFCCMEKVNAVIHRIWGAALFNKMYDDLGFKSMLSLRSMFPKTYSRVDDTIRTLSLSDMSGAFYLLLIGYILAVICLLCEIISHGYFCRNQVIPNFRRKMYRKRD